MDDPQRPRLWGASRRAWIRGGIVLGVGLVASALALRPVMKFRREVIWGEPVATGPGTELAERSVVRAIAHFAGSVFGRELNENDVDELVWRFDYLIAEDDAWRVRLSQFAERLDQLSITHANVPYENATQSVREHLAEQLWADRERPYTRLSELRAFVSRDERMLRELHMFVIPKITSLYTSSGVPWRARGYTSWRGVPGDPREYTHQGNPRP